MSERKDIGNTPAWFRGAMNAFDDDLGSVSLPIYDVEDYKQLVVWERPSGRRHAGGHPRLLNKIPERLVLEPLTEREGRHGRRFSTTPFTEEQFLTFARFCWKNARVVSIEEVLEFEWGWKGPLAWRPFHQLKNPAENTAQYNHLGQDHSLLGADLQLGDYFGGFDPKEEYPSTIISTWLHNGEKRYGLFAALDPLWKIHQDEWRRLCEMRAKEIK